MIEQTFVNVVKTKLESLGFSVYCDYPDKDIEQLEDEVAFLNFDGLELEDVFRGLATNAKYYVYNLKCSVRLYTNSDLLEICSQLADNIIKYKILTHVKPKILSGGFDNVLGRVQGNIEISVKAMDKVGTAG